MNPMGTDSGVKAGPAASTRISRPTRAGASVAKRHAISPPSELPPSTTRCSFSVSSTSTMKRA